VTGRCRRRGVAVGAALLCGWAATPSCATRTGPALELPSAPSAAHFVWVRTECVDGRLPLAETGFQQALTAARVGETLELTFDTAMADRGCTDLTSVTAEPHPSETGQGALWAMRADARVTLPMDARCGPPDAHGTLGQLWLEGEALRLTLRRSGWCRGFDATVHYRIAPAAERSAEEVVRRYLLRFARRDAEAAARLFADNGSLVEPFTQHPDGRTTRHRGRAEVGAWLERTLQGPRWSAVRVRSVESSGPAGQFIAEWEYMDDALSAPVVARNLFVVADGEIFETEVQLLSVPRPRAAPEMRDGGTAGVSSIDAATTAPN